MPKGYQHLTYDQRCQFAVLKNSEKSLSQIAKELGVHRCTLCRELARNGSTQGYKHEQAHSRALERRRRVAKNRSLLMQTEVMALIKEKLRLQWSPEQISGWLKREAVVGRASHETIYRLVREDKRNGGMLYRHLRHGGKKYNKRVCGKAGRGCIPGRVDITERPSIVEEKSRLGDWEADTIIGSRHKGVIVSMVERHSKLTLLSKVPRRGSMEVKAVLKRRLGEVAEHVHTLTFDNGKEFAEHLEVAQHLDAKVFFARPYHSWERGLNEHTNGLVRQYLPKNERLDLVSDETIRDVEELLNNRPRKVLQFRTPLEVFNERRKEVAGVALQS